MDNIFFFSFLLFTLAFRDGITCDSRCYYDHHDRRYYCSCQSKNAKGATMLLFVGFLNFFIFIIYVIAAINLTDGWCKYSTCFDRSSSKNKGKVNISLWLDNYSEIDYFFIFSKYLLQAF